MLDRMWNRLKSKLPLNQSAYQPGRGTTEQVHAVKLLVEKAIISSDYVVHLLLLDMSKAFDTVDRNKLFEHLDEIMHGDELYILHILTNNPQLQVKIGNTTGELFISVLFSISMFSKTTFYCRLFYFEQTNSVVDLSHMFMLLV